MSGLKKIWVLFIFWIVVSISAVLLINKYVADKKIRLLKDIRHQVTEIFEGQDDGSTFMTFDYGLFDSQMNGGVVKNYTKTSIPSKPQKKDINSRFDSLYQWHTYDNELQSWNDSYGDVASLWNLNWGSDQFNEIEDLGWEIVGMRYHGVDDSSCIHTFTLFPYQVALKKTKWENYFTVPQAVQSAFEFYTSGKNSPICDRYESGSYKRIWNKLFNSENDYYGIYKNENHNGWYVGKPIPGSASPEQGGPIQNGWMHNDYYRVYVAVTQGEYHGIMLHPWAPAIKEQNKLIIVWQSIIFIIFGSLITLMLVRNLKEARKNEESLKQRLLRVCSPSNYMSNYNKEKVSLANSLYQEILYSEDEFQLLEIANKVEKQLSISIIEESEVEKLKQKVNPTLYMKPYNAQKVAMANELFSIISNTDLTYSDFIKVKEKSKLL
ncbi:MAG: hypothetical protein K2J12_03740 [Muribaculaceae bacterium]|nr:hypothetical protein [Muribaculaceae bacterium]